MNTYLIIGSGGIGSTLAQELVNLGNHVHLCSRSGNLTSEGNLVVHTIGDIALEETLLPTIETPLKGLIYCPGTINLRPFKAFKQAEFMHDLQVNYLGAIRATQKYLPNLLQQEGASITLFSTVAVQKGMPFHASIAGAKGAVEGLTKSLAAEFAPKIRVNAIAPSLTQTPLADKLLNAEAKIIAAGDRHPLKKIGQAKNITSAVHYLLQNDWVTGQILAVDGGMSTLSNG
ncbi:MAG: SDR family oxidoreductase [Bacteroidetes bacterium]|jgi:3-oxoacyl-[acyl-carrier protein] reductase|nr:SDR family oxidoreductase [Bacteroidota bacterium]